LADVFAGVWSVLYYSSIEKLEAGGTSANRFVDRSVMAMLGTTKVPKLERLDACPQPAVRAASCVAATGQCAGFR
jgi:hypothetical protein